MPEPIRIVYCKPCGYVRQADEAMYRAKSGRSHGVEFASAMRLGAVLSSVD